LRKLVRQAAGLATEDERLRRKAEEEAMGVLDHDFFVEEVSIVVATRIHKVIRDVTGNPDPYRAMKENEMAIARELFPRVRLQYNKDALGDYIRLAAAANAIDFFRSPVVIAEDMNRAVDFAIDDSAEFEAKLTGAAKVLYLADNAGEIYFDLPLVKKLRQQVEVKYVVKPSPVQDDATIEDIRNAGREDEFGAVITTGVASPGVILDSASTQFRWEFSSADLIIAKGMGYYESLSELPPEGKVFYCLMAKCNPVATSLGVPRNSYVAMLR
jgi:hypothetical protein